MSILEAAIVAALTIYYLFLLAILVEYITDKRARVEARKVAQPREEEQAVKKRSHHKKKPEPEPREEIPQPPGPGEQPAAVEEPPKEWKEEKFE